MQKGIELDCMRGDAESSLSSQSRSHLSGESNLLNEFSF